MHWDPLLLSFFFLSFCPFLLVLSLSFREEELETKVPPSPLTFRDFLFFPSVFLYNLWYFSTIGHAEIGE